MSKTFQMNLHNLFEEVELTIGISSSQEHKNYSIQCQNQTNRIFK